MAVVSQAGKVFLSIAQALEAETLQNSVATRSVAAAKMLLQIAGLNLAQVIQQLPLETQRSIQGYFA